MEAGYAVTDITPPVGVALAGFAARCDAPSTGVDDPLLVHALSLRDGDTSALLLSYDLLGIGADVLARIEARLDACDEIEAAPPHRIHVSTHTHSGPAMSSLYGCGIVDERAVRIVEEQTLKAARKAVWKRRRVRLRYAVLPFSGHCFNRRQILPDGRCVLAHAPDAVETAQRGPSWDELLLARLDDETGAPVAGLCHWAAHACTVCGSRISADWPGAFREGLRRRTGMPFMVLQGACGNLNAPFDEMTREEMQANVRRMRADVPNPVPWSQPVDAPLAAGRTVLEAHLQPPMPVAALQAFHMGMREIAQGRPGSAEARQALSNILNTSAGEEAPAGLLRHTASAMAAWADDQQQAAIAKFPLPLHALRLGPLAFCFVPGEVFVETALRLREAPETRGLLANVVGYGSPYAGYLPTDEAFAEGGYEVEHAYRFLGMPAPFAHGTEPALRTALQDLLRQFNA